MVMKFRIVEMYNCDGDKIYTGLYKPKWWTLWRRLPIETNWAGSIYTTHDREDVIVAIENAKKRSKFGAKVEDVV